MTTDSDSFCYSILSKYPIINVIPGLDGSIGVVGLFVGLLYFFNSGLTIYWIRHQKFNAEMGVERAARHVSLAECCSTMFLNDFDERLYFRSMYPLCGRHLYQIL